MSIKAKVKECTLTCARHGGAWWMPLVLMACSVSDALTGGAIIILVGPFMTCVFAIIALERKYTFFIAPVMMCAGGMIGAITYMQLLKSAGVDALLEKTGAADSTLLAYSKQLAADYGFSGLVLAGILPTPTPVAVVAGSLAGVEDSVIMLALFSARFIKFFAIAIAVKMGGKNRSAEEFVREQLGEKPKKKTK